MIYWRQEAKFVQNFIGDYLGIRIQYQLIKNKNKQTKTNKQKPTNKQKNPTKPYEQLKTQLYNFNKDLAYQSV